MLSPIIDSVMIFLEWLKSQTTADELSKGLAQSTVRTYSSVVNKYDVLYKSWEGSSPHFRGVDIGFCGNAGKGQIDIYQWFDTIGLPVDMVIQASM